MNDHPPYSQLEDYERLVPTDRHAAMAVAKIVDRYLAPTSILDLGCGNGVWLNVLANNGGRQVLGVEEARFAPLDLDIDPAFVVYASLARPLDLEYRFDLVICL
jgi:SAM-dependent methyltransferase